MIAAVVALPLIVGFVLGVFLVWPIARRVGEHDPDRLYWVPVSDPHTTGRRWVPVQPRPARVTLRTRLAAFWAATAPRDVHAPVRAAMSTPGHRPVWMDLPYDFIGQPPKAV